MQIDVTGKNIAVTPAMRARVDKHLQKIGQRSGPTVQRAHIVLAAAAAAGGAGKPRHSCDAHLDVDGTVVRAKSEGADMYAAIDATMEKIARQMQKGRGRRDG